MNNWDTQTQFSDFFDMPFATPIDLEKLLEIFKKLELFIDRAGKVHIKFPFCPKCGRRSFTLGGSSLKKTYDIFGDLFYFVCQQYLCCNCNKPYSAYIKHIIVYDEEMTNEKILVKLNTDIETIVKNQDEIYPLGEKINGLIENFIYNHIQLQMTSQAHYDKQDIMELVVRNSINTGYMETTRNLLDIGTTSGQFPSADTVMLYLGKKTLKDIKMDFRSIFEHLIQHYQEKEIISGPIDIAIDWHDEEYYGKQKTGEVVSAKQKNGTINFHRYLTVDCVENAKRFTLVGEHVSQFDDKLQVCNKLLDFIQTNKIEIKTAYFDRGFFNTTILNYLIDKIKYVMPVVKNEKVKKLAKENWENGKYVFKYHFGKGKSKSKEFTIFMIPNLDYDPSKKTDKTNTEYYIFSTNLEIKKSDFDAKTMQYNERYKDGYERKDIAKLYKNRWGIETGYRVVNQGFLGKTTSNNFGIRYFDFMIGLILRNIWVLSKTMFKPLYEHMFPKNTMTAKLWAKIVEKTFDRKRTISSLKSMVKGIWG